MDRLAIYELKRRAAAVFLPNLCPFCGRVIALKKYYCESCPELLPVIHGELAPPDNISRLYACCWYSGIARDAVHMMKFDKLIYPADAFGVMMSELLSGVEADALVPVPSGLKTVDIRGFAPAEDIAKRISIRLDIPVEKAIEADIYKLEQKMLTRKSRVINAKNSFFPAEDIDVRGKRLLLIDDVTTTGSTLSVLAGILRDEGAEDVAAAVFAKVPGSVRRQGASKIYRRRK